MINMQQGRIIKIISNQYTIQNEKEEIIAKPRGKMRQHEAPVVGDFVGIARKQGKKTVAIIRLKKEVSLRRRFEINCGFQLVGVACLHVDNDDISVLLPLYT